jgi:hypothetical protein
LIELNHIPYKKEWHHITYIDLENRIMNDFDGKKMETYELDHENSWEAFPP